MRLGLVHRILSLDSFVACKYPHRDHQTVFLICSRCQKVVEIPLGSGRQDRLESLFQEEEIKIERLVSLEFAGRCSACSSVATKPKRQSRNSNARHEGGRVAAE
jgi:Fur family zinc uptake transcriptional regulator